MAYFECIIGNGGSSTDIPLIVTCDSDFAGTTITCTDGTTTLTDTCPSSSPYTITFSLPNAGTWTVSGTVSGTPISESIVIQASELDLHAYTDITVDVYSAANDTVSYTGIDGQTHTITTNSSGSASATITVIASGSSITFTSSVAKNPNNLSQNYTRTLTLSSSTTKVYVMPVDDALYWYGYRGSKLESCNAANGWNGLSGGWTDPTYNTNYVSLNASVKNAGIASKTAVVTNSIHAIGKRTRPETYDGVYAFTAKNTSIDATFGARFGAQNTIVYAHANADGGNYYVTVWEYNSGTCDVFALWYE